MSAKGETDPPRGSVSWPILLGTLAFLALSGLFAYMLLMPGRVASVVPSALIGRDAPATDLPAVPAMTSKAGDPMPGFGPGTLAGKISLVNVWGSWCAPCRQEHPHLMELARDSRIQIVGINYKDTPENAIRFLNQLGNPYDAVGADGNGRTAIEWGVYGVPETFLVGPDGIIAYKHVGPLSQDAISSKLTPEIEKLLANR